MKSRNSSETGPTDQAMPEPSLPEQLETCFKIVFIILSIERELNQEIKRFRNEGQKGALTAPEKQLPRIEQSDKKAPKSSKNSASKSRSKVLTTPTHLRQSINVFNFYSVTKSQLARIERGIWRCLIPDPKDRAMIAKLDLQNNIDKADACQRLINETSVFQNATLQTLRVSLLNNFLARLEEDIHQKEMQLSTRQVQAMAGMLERTSRALKNVGSRNSVIAQAITRMEQRLFEQEAKLAEALDVNGCIIKHSPTIFEKMEQKVAASEELAKASLEKIANLPPVETNSMSAAQIKKTLSDFSLANKEMEKWCASLDITERETIQVLAKYREQATVWKERQMMAELKENAELANQAKTRRIGVLDASLHVGQSLEAIRAIKELIQQRLDEISLVSAKLAERLAEIEHAKEPQTNVN